jgi:hypothetical protein
LTFSNDTLIRHNICHFLRGLKVPSYEIGSGHA